MIIPNYNDGTILVYLNEQEVKSCKYQEIVNLKSLGEKAFDKITNASLEEIDTERICVLCHMPYEDCFSQEVSLITDYDYIILSTITEGNKHLDKEGENIDISNSTNFIITFHGAIKVEKNKDIKKEQLISMTDFLWTFKNKFSITVN